MNCPSCKNVALVMSDRQGIEIDYCPNCRGIWLDRGELDKIIERSLGVGNNQSFQQTNYPNQHFGFGKSHDHHKYHRKKSWLNELFD